MQNKNKYNKTLLACYLGFVVQAICANFVPLLYIVFHDNYNISFGQLALISTTFFFTQLIVDYICGRVVDKIGYRPSIVASEITCCAGLSLLAVLPDIMPSPFIGILICVTIYAIGSGLIEVLVSPIIEACPFDNKDVMMSLLHSFYCWGTVGVIFISTIFFKFFGIGNWKLLAILWAIVPFYNIFNFATCPIEKLVDDGQSMTMGELLRSKTFWLFILLMVCAGSSEISMSQWASAFVESALHMSKAVGDLAGPCGFAVLMGISRTLYGKFGEKIDLTGFMIASGILCLICYLLAALSKAPVMGLVGCALCGFSVGIMWPGSISISSKVIPRGGTAMFALLALAGDLGGASGPAIIGYVSQFAGNNIQAGILSGIGFPIVLVICVLVIKRVKNNDIL
ncbi:MFS transporter [Butyrivibrio fibrisolvens]|uniref:MFS transporter n=1 Tax=Butyrivibrio fibrisolvens TaxID=831 RepID=UPI0003FE3FB6|nr:MFS transporter [Butyrivibrio fibrisolvens]